MSLRERLIELRDEHLPSQGEPLDCVAFGQAVYRMALEEAARECEQKWRDGYRGEVTVGFAHVIRALAENLK